jgi:hypothetical protein
MLRLVRPALLLLLPLLLSCASGSTSHWRPYIFNGTSFSPADRTTSGTIWLRRGHFPAISDTPPADEHSNLLSPKTGAVAGICYLQTSGGKLSGHTSFTPYPDEQITLKNETHGVLVTRTDKNGAFAEHLPTGVYELFCRGGHAVITIQHGETTLTPIRGGKRMVD